MKQPYIDISDAQPIIVPKLEAKLAKYGIVVCGTTYLWQRKIMFCLLYSKWKDPNFQIYLQVVLRILKDEETPPNDSW